jgi:hypothetical protein
MEKDFYVISFYTENSLYEKDVKDLVASCEKFHIPHVIESVPNLGSWEKNCCLKPKYILEKIEELKKPVVWIDADAIVVQKPQIFPLSCDIAAYHQPLLRSESGRKTEEMIQSGTLFVNYTPNAVSLLKKWDRECERRLRLKEKKREKTKKEQKEVWDQACLNDLLKREKNILFETLPLGYCRVFDQGHEKIPMEETFILHFQASRFARAGMVDPEEISFLQNMDSCDLKFMRFKRSDLPNEP